LAKNKPKKKPAAKVAPTGGKQPYVAVDPDEAAKVERLSWRFSILDYSGSNWGWETMAPAKVKDVHSKLCHHEGMTLAQFFVKKGTNKIPLASVCKEAQKRAEALNLDDVDDLVEIRLAATERVWGTMTGPVFNLLWWDPNHTVYPVSKKHT